MERKEQILKQIEGLNAQLEPLKKELSDIYLQEGKIIKARIEKAYNGDGDFDLSELHFAATSRCVCGAGSAYPNRTLPNGSWHCSAILMGQASREIAHDGAKPFAFYEIKSEDQPSANGATTRPTE